MPAVGEDSDFERPRDLGRGARLTLRETTAPLLDLHVRFLVDTNVIAELRKGTRADPHVRSWFEAVDPDAVLLSVLTLGERRRGVENVRRRDPSAARALERWRRRLVFEHGERMLPVDLAVAEQWALLNVPDPIPVIDGLFAATARVHDLTFVSRNVKDVARTSVRLLNPFERSRSREPLP